MSLIKIQPEAARQQSSRFSQTASDLTNMYWEINRLANQLDWEVRGKGHVESNIRSAASMGKALYQESQRLSDYLKSCALAMEEADSQGQQSIASTASAAANLNLNTGAILGVGVVGTGVLAGLIAGGKSFGVTALSWIKGIFGWADGGEMNRSTVDTGIKVTVTGESANETAETENNYEKKVISLSRGTGDVEVDSFKGVPAFAGEKNFDAADNKIGYVDVGYQNGEHNCAEYIKRFYKTKYDMVITGLGQNGTPSGLHLVTNPSPGDVMYVTVNGGPHWAIVKQVNASTGTVTVIEQNTVFKSGNDYEVKINNQYNISSAKFFSK